MELVISKEKAKELYPTASKELKVIFEETFGRDFFIEKITDKVKTWEDAAKICFDGSLKYFINQDSNIDKISNRSANVYNKKFVNTEKQAKSILAYSQLLVIQDALNEGVVEPSHYNIIWDIHSKCFITDWCSSYSLNTIRFNSIELAEHVIKYFEPLLKDFFMID
jgi:hypothetical protein